MSSPDIRTNNFSFNPEHIGYLGRSQRLLSRATDLLKAPVLTRLLREELGQGEVERGVGCAAVLCGIPVLAGGVLMYNSAMEGRYGLGFPGLIIGAMGAAAIATGIVMSFDSRK